MTDIPKCRGVSRDGENPRAAVVWFDRHLTQDDLNTLQETLSRPDTRAQIGREVVSKPLVWEDCDTYTFTAWTEIGSYNIDRDGDGWWAFMHECHGDEFEESIAYPHVDDNEIIETLKAECQRDLDKRVQSLALTPSPRRVKHIKRGSIYQIVAEGMIQTDRPLKDYDSVTVYRDEYSEMVWIRPIDEFEDPSRFEELPATLTSKPEPTVSHESQKIAMPDYGPTDSRVSTVVTLAPVNGEPAKLEVCSCTKPSDAHYCLLHVEIDGQRTTFDPHLVTKAIQAALTATSKKYD